MTATADVARETIVNARTSQAAAGTATVGTFTTVDGIPIYKFDQLVFHVRSSQSIGGGATLDLLFQYAVVPNPDPANAAHWDDFGHSFQYTGASDEVYTVLSRSFGRVDPGTLTSWRHSRAVNGSVVTASNSLPIHPGDAIRVLEVVGGTPAPAMIYSIHAMGVIF